MSWIWQQQNGSLSNKIKRNTGWKSPNVVSQCLPSNINVVTSEKTDPIDPTALQTSINAGETTYNDRKQTFYNENGNPIIKSLWNDLNNIKTVSNNKYDYATLLSINTYDENVTYMSPLISCRDFDFNIPTGTTITGIEIKITKSAYSEPSAQASPSTCGDSNSFVEYLYYQGITNYTYDDVVTISLNDTCNSDFYNDTLFSNTRNDFNNNLNSLVPQYSFISNYTNYANPWIADNWDLSIPYYVYNLFGYDETPILNYYDNTTTHQIIPPKGVWTVEKNTQIYGGEEDMWGNITGLTPDSINNSNFGMYFKCNQYIPRSYSGSYYNRISFNNNGEKQLYFDNILNETPYNSCVGYEVSKLHDIQIRVHYELDASVKTLDARENIFLSGTTLSTDDIYFKFQKCFDGICYQYVNNITNIYDISLMTGDGISITNMYNEYNIIDEYCSNIYRVDIATKEQIDLNINHFEIDNIKMKPGHKVLLLEQQNASDNDIYMINDNYFLENSNLLSTRESAYRAKIYVKMGTYEQKQYFLTDFGNQFPITGETKNFTTGHSYMIKNYIDYNIKNIETGYTYDISGNTIGNPNKIIFTNYKVARSLSETKTWNDIEFTPTSAITINYLNDSYSLTSEYDMIYYDMTGSTSSQTYSTWNGLSFFVIDSNFYNHSSIGDHSLISFKKGSGTFDTEMIPTSSEFNYLSKIRYIDSNYVAFDEIPSYMINDILTGNTAYTFRVRNLHYCSATTNSYEDYLNYSPYGDILDFRTIGGLNIKPYQNSDYYKWFDFNLITINNIINGVSSAYTFKTNNQYQNYKLKTFLDNLGTTPELIYNSAYYLSDEYYIEEIWEHTSYNRDGSFHSLGGASSTYYNRQSSRWKIIPYDTTKLSQFRPNTYIDYGVLTTGNTGVITPYSFIDGDTGRTLITEVNDKYMIVEKPRLEHDPDSSYYNPTTNKLEGLTYDIINVSKTQDISDILYELYLSYEHSYYYYYSDSFYNRICSSYAEIIKENRLIRNMTSGILYQKNDLFNFDIFNINIDDNFNHLDDVNLTYKPIELIDIGIDGKTKLPIPLVINNIDIKNSSFPYFTGHTEFDYGSIEHQSFMRDSVIVNNKLHFLIQYQGKLYFNGEETSGGTYLQKYYTQNNATLVFDKNLSETELSYYYYMDNRNYNSTNIGFFNSKIKSDSSGKTYQFGISTHDDITWDNTNTSINVSSTNTLNDSIKRIGAAKDYDIGYLIVYENNGNINTAITYSGEANRLTYTNDIETIDNYNYVYNANNGDYYQSKNNAGRNLLYDGPGGKKSSMLLRYSDNFNTIDWKILYHSLDINGNIYQLLNTDKSLKIIKDFDENYLYQTLSTKKGTNKLKIERINSAYTYFYQYDDILYTDYNTFSIIKLSKDGDFNKLKSIYYPDVSGSSQSPELKNIIYEDEYLYVLINTNTKIIIDDVIYGENSIEIKHYIIKLNNLLEVMWVNILGELNDTIGTDMKLYDNKILFVSGYFKNTTKISNYKLTSNGDISSYVCKIDIESGDVLSVLDKHSTEIIKIKTLDIVDDNIYIGGDWIGGTFLGGIRQINYIETTNSRVFVERIKINSI